MEIDPASGVTHLSTEVKRVSRLSEAVRYRADVRYAIGVAWLAVLTAEQDADEGFVFTRVEFIRREGGARGGINSQALRLIPFREAAASAQSALLEKRRAEAPPIPDRYDGPEDYVGLAISYSWFTLYFPSEPVKWMAEAAGVTKSTLSSRLDRARALGFLDPGRSGERVSDKALEFLDRLESEEKDG